MSYDEARQAFDPFFRALRVREQQGTGLGLSIVKRVIEASGGSVAVDSRLGQGTTFVIRLPQASDNARAS
jgi:signal transduction histidine kinase